MEEPEDYVITKEYYKTYNEEIGCGMSGDAEHKDGRVLSFAFRYGVHDILGDVWRKVHHDIRNLFDHKHPTNGLIWCIKKFANGS